MLITWHSRQERRKAERDAAKRAPAQAGAVDAGGAMGACGVVGDGGAMGAGRAVGAGGAADAEANVNMDPVGEWTTQAADPNALRALGVDVVKQKAAAGDREAQWSLGYSLMCEDGVVGKGLHSFTFQLNLSRV